MPRHLWTLCATLFLSVSSLQASDFAGIWSGATADRNGDLEDFSFRFTPSGGSLTGKMYGINESTPVTDLTVTGETITFVVTTELNGSITKTRYVGTLVGGDLHVTRERMDAKKPPEKPSPRQVLILKRLA